MGTGTSGKWKYNPFTRNLDIVGVCGPAVIGYPFEYTAEDDITPVSVLATTLLGLFEADANKNIEVSLSPAFPIMENFFEIDNDGNFMAKEI
jgi:hypothetical protein